MKRLLATSAVAAVIVVAWAEPAAAHAELKSSDPVGGAVLEDPPAQVTLAFTEPVEAPDDAIRVYDHTGTLLDSSRPRHPDGRGAEVTADLPDLVDGAYVVTWQVISGDSHPVHGAFTFRVGEGPAADTQALLGRLLASGGGDATVGAAFGAVRLAAFAALILVVGGTAFLLVLWPEGRRARRVRWVIAGAWVAAVATTVAGIALQGVYGTSRSLDDALRWSVIDGVLDTRFGRAWLARLALLALAAPLLVALGRAGSRRAWLVAPLGLIGAGLLVTPGLAGHPGADTPAALSVIVDAVHLGSVSFWLGGLALLAVALLRPRNAHQETARIVGRFSRWAFVSVIIIAATGLFQGWRQSRQLDAVTGTTYGRLLLIKLALFAVLLGLAGFSRAWVRRRVAGVTEEAPLATTDPVTPPISQLRWSVGAEVGVAVIVLAVTALLVNTVPARTALAEPFSIDVLTTDVVINLTLDPAKAGPIDVHAYSLTHQGASADVEELTVALSLPDRDVGPLDVPMERTGLGHYSAFDVDIPIPGEWQLDVTARTSDINQETATIPVRIR